MSNPNDERPSFEDYISGVDDLDLSQAYERGLGEARSHHAGLRAVLRLLEPAYRFLMNGLGDLETRASAHLERLRELEVKSGLVDSLTASHVDGLRQQVQEGARLNAQMRQDFDRLAHELMGGHRPFTADELATQARTLVIRSAVAHAVVLCLREMRKEGTPIAPGGFFEGILGELESLWKDEAAILEAAGARRELRAVEARERGGEPR